MNILQGETTLLYPKDNFDLRKTMLSGQVFNYQEVDGWFIIFNRGEFAAVRQVQKSDTTNSTQEKICPIEVCSTIAHFHDQAEQNPWIEYFDLNTNYTQVVANMQLDEFAAAAYECSKGIHILKQDSWEMCISYLVSQRNNLNNIGNIIRRISEKFGDKDDAASKKFGIACYSFPSPSQLAAASEEELATTGVGFRNKYIQGFAQWAATHTMGMKAIALSSSEGARRYLMRFSGIGPKVANCILLFGYYRIDQFPIDLWMKRIIDEVYGGNLDHRARYGKFAGIIQQYMFNYVRNHDGLSKFRES